jgi:hypothetical protein
MNHKRPDYKRDDALVDEALLNLAAAWRGTKSARLLTDVVGGGFERLRCYLEEDTSKLDAVAELLGKNGCDCDCGHDSESHNEDCDRCLACRIARVIGA